MKYLSLFVFFLSAVLHVHANIGESAEKLVKRYGKPDNNQALLNGKKMFWNSIKGIQITVVLRKRGDQTVSVSEKLELTTGRLLTTEMAGKLLRKRRPDGKWRMIKNEKHDQRGNVLRSRITEFQHSTGQFAVYVWRLTKSPVKAKAEQEAFLIFLDPIAFEEFREEGSI